MKIRRLVLVTAGTLASLVSVGAPRASADVEGPCTGSLNGVDASTRSSTDPDDAIKVDKDDVVEVVVQSPQTIQRYEIRLSFAGFRWTVASDTTNSSSWTRTVEVKDYSRFGVGLYQVHAVSEGAERCEGSVLVRVGGSPFGSLAGWVALALTAVGVGATVMAARTGGRRTPAGAMVLGAFGGLGVIALGQQFSVAYPTRIVTLVGVGVGIVAPLVAARLTHTTGPNTEGPVDSGLDDRDLPQGPAPDVWTADHVVPPEGMTTWDGPDASSGSSQPLAGGVDVRVLERVGDRVHVECSNGWTTWVDARGLEGL